MKREVRLSSPETMSKPVGYSHVAEISSGKLVYIAGQVALDRDGRLVGENDFERQLRQVFSNLDHALKQAGCSFRDVVKLNYFCSDTVDASSISVVRAVRDEYVNQDEPPVSTFVYVPRLVRPEWLIEVEAVAVAPR
ncbi:MAG TPA: RidA family protein [Candidatus Dormibacteraeota bacterium]|nr:RidA family protein [Candidatus Dormibacteraeota bacterium]